jgi:(p)ppGpp synthase/HD superfamily hydrolase
MSNSTVLTDRFIGPPFYATHVHGGQVRKGTSTPHVAHLLAVAATVLEYGGDEDLAIAALLHDSVEDQGGKAKLEDVRNRFGERVARMVEACSDSLADTAKGERNALVRTKGCLSRTPAQGRRGHPSRIAGG